MIFTFIANILVAWTGARMLMIPIWPFADIGGLQFKLVQAKEIADNQSFSLPSFKEATGRLSIPVVAAFSRYFQVEMQANDGLFSVASVKLL